MTRFRYTIVSNDFPEDAAEALVSADELGVGDVAVLGDRRYVVEQVENTGETYWDSETGTTMIVKRLHCRVAPGRWRTQARRIGTRPRRRREGL